MDRAAGDGDGSHVMFQAPDGRTVIISSETISSFQGDENIIVLRQNDGPTSNQGLNASHGSDGWNPQASSYAACLSASSSSSSHVTFTPTQEHSYTRIRPPSYSDYKPQGHSEVTNTYSHMSSLSEGQFSHVPGVVGDQHIENIPTQRGTLRASTKLWHSQSFTSPQKTQPCTVSVAEDAVPLKMEVGSPKHTVIKTECESPKKVISFGHKEPEGEIRGHSQKTTLRNCTVTVVTDPSQKCNDSVPHTKIQKTILVPTGHDSKTATQAAISHITEDLNRQAAARLARGQCPEQETVIEITQIATPGEGYFSQENLQHRSNHNRMLNYSLQGSKVHFTPPPDETAHPGSPAQARTASPIPLDSSVFIDGQRMPEHLKVSGQSVQFVTSQDTRITDSTLAGLGQSSSVVYTHPSSVMSCQAASKLRVETQSLVKLSQSSTFSSGEACLRGGKSVASRGLSTVLKSSFIPSQTVNSSGSSSSSNKDNTVSGSGLHRIILTDGQSKHAKPVLVKTSHVGPSKASSVSEIGLNAAPKDDSLTNIQWLGHISSQAPQVTSLVPASLSQQTPCQQQQDLRIIATEKQIEKISRECGRKKRPPYSYMHLIQMAICSRADKRMTLKEIYKWIEDKFPYYKHSPKQGWKNSIRHNLSLYNIFVRQKSTIPGKTGCSYWTLSTDVTSKSTKSNRYNPPTLPALPAEDNSRMNCSYIQMVGPTGRTPQIVHMSPSPCTNVPNMLKSRKGPAPLLPKLPVPTVQAYALIPIPAGMSVMSPQQMVMAQQWPQTATSNTSFTALNSSHNSSICSHLKRACENSEMDVLEPNRKHVKIAPKASILGDKSGSMILKGSPVVNISVASAPSLDTTDLQQQLSRICFDSGIDLRCSSDLSSSSDSHTKGEGHEKQGLPQPKMYRSKRPRKDKVVVRKDCDEEDAQRQVAIEGNQAATKLEGNKFLQNCDESDNPVLLTFNDSALSETGINDILASIEKDFTSPMRGLLKTPRQPEDKGKSTSTPLDDGAPISPSWISPIKGVTPPTSDNSQLDSGFFTPEGKLATSTPYRGSSGSRSSAGSLGSGQKSPLLGSLRELGLPGLTPLKSPRKRPTRRGSLGASPQLSLRELGLTGLTPLKTPGNSDQTSEGTPPNGSPSQCLSFSNQSFQKLLGDIHLDSMMDDGVDIGNLSFLQNEGSPL